MSADADLSEIDDIDEPVLECLDHARAGAG